MFKLTKLKYIEGTALNITKSLLLLFYYFL